jgi:hypothetical protein
MVNILFSLSLSLPFLHYFATSLSLSIHSENDHIAHQNIELLPPHTLFYEVKAYIPGTFPKLNSHFQTKEKKRRKRRKN